MKEPRKHIRHRLLVEFGLLSKANYDCLIRRYDIKDISKCVDDIEKALNDPIHVKNFDANYITVIKPVITQNLPVFIIKDKADVQRVREQLKTFDRAPFVEAWFDPFRTHDTVWGRIEFEFSELFPQIIPTNLELTCGMSCREINLYPNITQAYMSFSKSNLTYPFTLKETKIVNPDRNYIVNSSNEILKLIPQYQKRLLDVATIFKSIGANAFSLDFQYTNNDLMFWDFDTDDDDKILTILEQNNI